MPAKQGLKTADVLTYGALGLGAWWLYQHRSSLTAAPATPSTTPPTTPPTSTGGGSLDTTIPGVGPVITPPVQPVSFPGYTSSGPVVLPAVSAGAPGGTVVPSGGTPSQVVYTPYGPVYTSNFSQPTTGPVATCLQRKPNWNQSQCEQRLATLVSAYNNDLAHIKDLQPGGAGYAAAQAEIDKYKAIIVAQTAQRDAQPDAASKAVWQTSINNFTQTINDIQSRLTTQLQGWQAAAAEHRNGYHDLTAVWL